MANLRRVSTTSSGRSSIYFRRYTSIASVLDVLKRSELTLLSPLGWDDENDRECMASYKERKGAKTLLALCLTEAVETFHHWKSFTNGQDGACIYFHKEKLREHLGSQTDIQFESVEYLTPKNAESGVSDDKLPFRKFSAYSAEREWRMVYQSPQEHPTKGVAIPRDVFHKISLNPWLPPPLVETVQHVINIIGGFKNLKVDASKIRKNEEWLTNVLKQ